MDERDQFAMAAMPAVVAWFEAGRKDEDWPEWGWMEVAEASYEAADAMLKWRARAAKKSG